MYMAHQTFKFTTHGLMPTVCSAPSCVCAKPLATKPIIVLIHSLNQSATDTHMAVWKVLTDPQDSGQSQEQKK